MSAPTKIAVRADGGPAVGMGHFARTAAVAHILSASGDTEITLLCNGEGAAMAATYFPANTRIMSLTSDDLGPEGAMGIFPKSEWAPEVIILDQYGSVPEWEIWADNADIPLVVFDDFDVARRADVIVRPHGDAKSEQGKNVLAGPTYLPLSRHVTDLARSGEKVSQDRLRLNICFGGSDPTGETAKALQAVADLEEFEIDVITGPGAQISQSQIEATEKMPHVTLHHAPEQKQLAELVHNADIALGAGGVMLWERLCLGVPSLVISIAQNQQPQIDTMIAAGAIQFLGEHKQVTPEKIAQAVMALAADQTGREAMAEIGQNLVDGRGASRLASWIRALSLGIREVELDDANDLLNWRTDDRNWQHNFETIEKPTFDAHKSWLSAKLAHPNCIFRIITYRSAPVGVVRFDINDEDSSAYLSIYLVPEWHGKGMGLPVYLAAERELRRCCPNANKIVSRIHGDNKASERLHRDAGFEISASPDRTNWLNASKLLS